jgi:molybdopterin molybdotransferase
MSSGLLSYKDAAARVASRAAKIRARVHRTEQAELTNAAGRVLAEAIRADSNMPSFPRSTRDGFACQAAEAATHAWLTVAGSIRAGDPPAGLLPQGTVWEIMTGAAVPGGADAVAMLEHVEHRHIEQRGDTIRLVDSRTLEAGENVVPEGAEARAGDEVVPAGTRLSPSQIAAAATCGYAGLPVFVRPRVAILTTGDELVPVSSVPEPGQIRNSNAPMLAALVAAAGGVPWVLHPVRDDGAAIEAALREALQADLLLVSGGVSAGKFDLVEPALDRLGAQVHFTGVRIQPGKPLVHCEIPRAGDSALPVFGLPGNPISSAATFLLFAAPVLAALSGSSEVCPCFFVARLSRDVQGKPGLTRFVPSALTPHPLAGGAPEVAPVNWQGSGDLAAFARANCFVAVPEGIDRLPAGERVQILPF